jgi:hypothetical protein
MFHAPFVIHSKVLNLTNNDNDNDNDTIFLRLQKFGMSRQIRHNTFITSLVIFFYQLLIHNANCCFLYSDAPYSQRVRSAVTFLSAQGFGEVPRIVVET